MIIPKVNEIKKRRQEMKLTRCGLSRKAGLSVNAIQRIETRESSYTHPIRARAIANALECELEDIFIVK